MKQNKAFTEFGFRSLSLYYFLTRIFYRLNLVSNTQQTDFSLCEFNTVYATLLTLYLLHYRHASVAHHLFLTCSCLIPAYLSGDMMLGGWKMLATHCPICNSALLQKELKVQCASCNMPVMTEEQYSARPTSENVTLTANTVIQESVTSIDSHSLTTIANSVISNNQPTKTAAAAVITADPTTAASAIPKNTTLSLLSDSIANTRKLQENQGTFFSVDNFDGYYSDNDNIGITNTLEMEKKEYDRNNKQRDVISVKLGEQYVTFCCCCC